MGEWTCLRFDRFYNIFPCPTVIIFILNVHCEPSRLDGYPNDTLSLWQLQLLFAYRDFMLFLTAQKEIKASIEPIFLGLEINQIKDVKLTQ